MAPSNSVDICPHSIIYSAGTLVKAKDRVLIYWDSIVTSSTAEKPVIECLQIFSLMNTDKILLREGFWLFVLLG